MTNEIMTQPRARTSSQQPILALLALCVLLPNLTFFFNRGAGLAFRDFKIFYIGAYIMHSGQTSQLYDPNLQYQLETSLLQLPPDFSEPYNHPPFELLLFLPFARLPFEHAFYVWAAISLCLGVASAALISRALKPLAQYWSPLPYLIVLAPFAFTVVLVQGQDTAVALLLVVLAWLSFRGGAHSRAGFWLALGLFKFQFFILLAAFLALRKMKLLAGFALGTASVLAASFLMVRPAGVLAYFRFVTRMARVSSQGADLKFGYPRLMPNLRGFIYGLASGGQHTPQHTAAAVALVVLLLASLLIFLWAAHRIVTARPDSAEVNDLVFALAVVMSCALSFHQLIYDLTLLTLPFAIIVNHLLTSTTQPFRRNALAGIIALFYVLPVYLVLRSWSLIFLLAPPILAVAFLISDLLTPAVSRQPETSSALPA
jgi:hypothetical protein